MFIQLKNPVRESPYRVTGLVVFDRFAGGVQHGRMCFEVSLGQEANALVTPPVLLLLMLMWFVPRESDEQSLAHKGEANLEEGEEN